MKSFRLGVVLATTAVALLNVASALALPEEERERGQTPLEQAREESGLERRPSTTFDIPAGELRLSASSLLAARHATLELSVTLNRALDQGELDLTLPAAWIGRSPVSGVRIARIPEAGRGASRDGRIVRLTFAAAKAGDTAKFSLEDNGIAAGTYRLPFRWREPGRSASGLATVIVYAPVREAGEKETPTWVTQEPLRDINATNDASTESETFMSVVPGNPQRFIVGVNGGGGYNGWITNDGGTGFTKAPMSNLVDAPGEALPETLSLCCDPMSAADAAGDIWYGGLATYVSAANPSRIVVARSAPGTTSFVSTVGMKVRAATTGVHDKPMMTIDNSPTSPHFGRLYIVWDEPGAGVDILITQCDTRPGGVLNAANCDNADNWSDPVPVTPAEGSYIYADVAAGPDGEVYVVWWDYSATNAIRGDVCTPAENCASAAGWGTPSTIATLDATGGSGIPFACPILAQPGGRASTSPNVDVDISGGPNNGRVYVAWSDLRTGSGSTKCGSTPNLTHLTFDNFVASKAGGLPGSAAPSPTVATRLLTDGEGGGETNSDDWFTWLAVDQTNGQAWADFYSTRDDATRKTTNFYVRTVTPDGPSGHALGALTKVSTAPSDYSANPCCAFGNDYGDYTGIDATSGIGLPVWSDRRAPPSDGEAFAAVASAPQLLAGTNAVDDSAAAGGDGDGALEPGESFRLTEPVRNVGLAAATGVSGTLTESDPNLTIGQPASPYPDVAAGAAQDNTTPFAGTLGAAAVCGAPVSMTLNVTTTQGPFPVPVSVPTGALGPVQTFNATPAVAIPDNAPAGVSPTQTVSGIGRLGDMVVRLNITHANVGDLTVSLISPGGTTVKLVQARGGSADNFIDTDFDDGAATAIGAGGAPFTGTFRPETPLSALDGGDANGTWTLKVVDSVAGNTGTVDSWRLSARAAQCAAPPPPPPAAVAAFTAAPAVEAVQLQWDDTATATGYEVFRRDPDGVTYPATATALTTTSEYLDTGRTAGTVYCYKVRAVNAGGPGPMSGEQCATAQAPAGPPPPGAVANLTATGAAESVILQWDDAPTATGYEVFRRDPDGVTYPATPTASPTSSAYTDTGRTAGTAYCYKVRAVNAGGPGPLSAEQCATATAAGGGGPGGGGAAAPAAVTGLVATGFPAAVALAWDDTPTATSYRVFRKGAAEYPALPTATVTVSEFADAGRTPGVPECYKIQPVNDVGAGPLSGEVCATPTAMGGPGATIKLDLSGLPATVRVSRRGRFSLSFIAPPAVPGTLAVGSVKKFVISKKRKVGLARKAFTATRADGHVTVALKLKKGARQLLSDKRKIKARVLAALPDEAAKATVTLKLKLR
jgi:subtilisin-like proprotein convertase family protein